MYKLLPLIERTVARYALNSTYPVSLSYRIKHWFVVFSGLMLVATVGFGLFSFYLWLSNNVSPVETMAYMGGATFVISLLSASFAFLILYLKVQKVKQAKERFTKTIEEGIALAEQELGEPILKNPKSAIAIATSAGFIVGDRFIK